MKGLCTVLLGFFFRRLSHSYEVMQLKHVRRVAVVVVVVIHVIDEYILYIVDI